MFVFEMGAGTKAKRLRFLVFSFVLFLVACLSFMQFFEPASAWADEREKTEIESKEQEKETGQEVFKGEGDKEESEDQDEVEVKKKKKKIGKSETEKNKKSKKKQAKKVYLTFDDGPSKNTDEVLKILDKYEVKATFFVIGKTDRLSRKRYKKIVESGHTIGLHSFTHKYRQIYANLKAFKKDFKRISDLVYDATGVRAKYYRFPGGTSNTISPTDMTVFTDYLKKEKIEYFDWNVQCGDAVRRPPSPRVLYNNVIRSIEKSKSDSFIVLIHDSKPMRNSIRALPLIIERLQKDGYQLLPIDDDTVPVHHLVRKRKK